MWGGWEQVPGLGKLDLRLWPLHHRCSRSNKTFCPFNLQVSQWEKSAAVTRWLWGWQQSWIKNGSYSVRRCYGKEWLVLPESTLTSLGGSLPRLEEGEFYHLPSQLFHVLTLPPLQCAIFLDPSWPRNVFLKVSSCRGGSERGAGETCCCSQWISKPIWVTGCLSSDANINTGQWTAWYQLALDILVISLS